MIQSTFISYLRLEEFSFYFLSRLKKNACSHSLLRLFPISNKLPVAPQWNYLQTCSQHLFFSIFLHRNPYAKPQWAVFLCVPPFFSTRLWIIPFSLFVAIWPQNYLSFSKSDLRFTFLELPYLFSDYAFPRQEKVTLEGKIPFRQSSGMWHLELFLEIQLSTLSYSLKCESTKRPWLPTAQWFRVEPVWLFFHPAVNNKPFFRVFGPCSLMKPFIQILYEQNDKLF